MENIRKINYKFNQNVLVRNVKDTTLVYNPEFSDMYELNDVGFDIFNLLKKELPIDELLSELCKQYDATEEMIYDDVMIFIDRMLELGVIKEV